LAGEFQEFPRNQWKTIKTSILQPFAKRLAVADFGNLKTNKTQQTLS
jgi:hypothetical protein